MSELSVNIDKEFKDEVETKLINRYHKILLLLFSYTICATCSFFTHFIACTRFFIN